jgi:cytochrome c oxidase subunit II
LTAPTGGTLGAGSEVSRRRARAGIILVLSVAALSGCTGPEAFLDAGGPAAREIRGLWWLMFGLGVTVYLGVLGLISVPLWRRWRRRHPAIDDVRELLIERRFVVWLGIVGPAIILFTLYLTAAPVLVATAPERANPDADEEVIEVIGHMFWWEVRYPDHDVVTANEITMPAGEEVRFRMTSADVIHAFWIPRLHGKVDMTPGHTTELVIEADEPGHFRGRCTEYCGIAHAQMILHVFAVEPDEYESWIAEQAEPAPEPETAEEQRGQEIFLDSCIYCHAVRGHGPSTEVGPDLTHFASRETLAAGILPLERDRLATWIRDPHELKPGAPMPGTALADEDLEALLDYLESLR